jgi:hypothetical protein
VRSPVVLGLTLSAAGLLWAPSALPCGGGFGEGLQINPVQNIVVSYKAGIETYFFSPSFCGQSAQFGYILPVPQKPSVPPSLGTSTTVSDLQALAAPTVQIICGVTGGGASRGGRRRLRQYRANH